MAYTTKYGIAEQVLLRIKAGRPDQATRLDIRDLIAMVPQVAAAVMKTAYYAETLPTGETIPNNLMLATFTVNTRVEGNRTFADLPARPISLPRGMGVYEVTAPDDPYVVYVPALPGQTALLMGQTMLADFPGLYYIYEVNGGTIEFNKNINKATLKVRMFIADIHGVEDTAPIPIPQDMEMEIIDKLFERFVNEPPANKNSDLLTDNKIQ